MVAKSLLNTTILLLLPFASLRAQIADPLWQKAQALVQASGNRVASVISVHTEVFDGDGKNQDIVDKKTQLTGWKDGEPVRAVVSLTETQKGGLGDAKFDLGLANHPEKALTDIATAQRQEESILDGKPCVLFQVAGKKKNKIPFTGKIWIEKATGLPLRVDYVFDPSSIPMTKAMTYSIVYAQSGNGHWLPRTVAIDTLMSIMFMKIKMTIRQTLDSWVARP